VSAVFSSLSPANSRPVEDLSVDDAVLDRGAHRLGVAHVREHLRRLVDRDDLVAACRELPRDATGAAAQLEQRRRRRHRGGHELALAPVGQRRVELDRAAVGSHRHGG
jgi:hypothetical protein